MVRTQIQFTEAQMEALRQLSAERGRSIADLTREALNLYLEHNRGATRDALADRALSVSGRFASGRRDISADHDRYLAEAFHE